MLEVTEVLADVVLVVGEVVELPVVIDVEVVLLVVVVVAETVVLEVVELLVSVVVDVSIQVLHAYTKKEVGTAFSSRQAVTVDLVRLLILNH